MTRNASLNTVAFVIVYSVGHTYDKATFPVIFESYSIGVTSNANASYAYFTAIYQKMFLFESNGHSFPSR